MNMEELDFDPESGQVTLSGEPIGKPNECTARVKRQLKYGVLMTNRLAAVYHTVKVIRDACPSCGSKQATWTVSNDAFQAGRCRQCLEWLVDWGGTWIRIRDGKQGFKQVENLLADKPEEVHYPEKDMVANGKKAAGAGDRIDHRAAERHHQRVITEPANSIALKQFQRKMKDLEIARKRGLIE
jgi:hypothetical protein